jgi:hypothetical protein
MSYTKLLCIYVTILLLFSYQLLLSELEVVLPIFVSKPTYFFVILIFAESYFGKNRNQTEVTENRNAWFLKFCGIDQFLFSRN